MKRATVLAILHFAILGAAGIFVLMLLILPSATGEHQTEAYVFLIASAGAFVSLLVLFKLMTCTRNEGIQILRALGATDIDKVSNPIRVIRGRWHNLEFDARFSRPYLEFWPYAMPALGPRGDHVPSGMEVLDVTNKLRDGGIVVYSDMKSTSQDESRPIQQEPALSERTFGSWMSKYEVEQIIRDGLREAEERLQGGVNGR